MFESPQLSLPFTLPPVEPRQRRVIALDNRVLAYELIRGKRRTMTITVEERGVTVRAPHKTAHRDIEGFIRSKARWLQRVYERLSRRPARAAWRHGERVPLLGADLLLAVSSGTSAVRRDGDTLFVSVADAHARQQIRAAVHAWAMPIARQEFGQRLAHFATKLGVPEPPFSVTDTSSRWGSCSPHCRIRLAWRLLHFPAQVIDYVVAHETAHLKHLDHSPRFWQAVESIYPTYRAAQALLRQRAHSIPE